jgi:hypothetical protein
MAFSGCLVAMWVARMTLVANPTMMDPSQGFVYECTRCGFEFLVPRNDWDIQQSAMGPFGAAKNCPLCQAKAVFAIPCSQCRANIIRPASDICPDCGVNIVEAINRRVKEAMARRAAQRAAQQASTRAAPPVGGRQAQP